jgi:NAD(P)-dependent dehydrogenase (short-subunit alcohol dehydrogenase family)
MSSDYNFDFAGERVFLTGGAQGMGRGIAEAFASWGAFVGVSDVNEEGARATAERINAGGGRAVGYRIDVTDEHSVDNALHAFIEEAGGLDLTINAAAVLSVDSVVDMSATEWRRVLDVNSTGSFLVARAAARAMIAGERGGSIICISSIGGKRGHSGLAHYSASKFAVIGLIQSLAQEVGGRGIRVNAVCPGTVDTQMIVDLAKAASSSIEEMVEEQIIKQPQTPTEIASGIAGLHVNHAITGQSLNVCGGSVFN